MGHAELRWVAALQGGFLSMNRFAKATSGVPKTSFTLLRRAPRVPQWPGDLARDHPQAQSIVFVGGRRGWSLPQEVPSTRTKTINLFAFTVCVRHTIFASGFYPIGIIVDEPFTASVDSNYLWMLREPACGIERVRPTGFCLGSICPTIVSIMPIAEAWPPVSSQAVCVWCAVPHDLALLTVPRYIYCLLRSRFL